jgi:hypothetical protein
MVDYEQVTKEIREGFSKIKADKKSKSEEIIMKEILKRFPTDLNRGDSQRNVDERVFAH